jgi:hypothetical protein
MRSFGVRLLAAAFLSASLLAGISTPNTYPRQQAGWGKSGSKLPHSKASHIGLRDLPFALRRSFTPFSRCPAPALQLFHLNILCMLRMMGLPKGGAHERV